MSEDVKKATKKAIQAVRVVTEIHGSSWEDTRKGLEVIKRRVDGLLFSLEGDDGFWDELEPEDGE